jgi:Putative MetA-pathway of phenol degradation
MINQQKIIFIIASLTFNLSAHASCGGAFCTLNTDAGVQGTWNKPGVRLDIRAEFIDMDQLRHGSSKAQPQGEVNEHDETRTLNRNFLATLDWNLNQDWGVTFRVPFVNRSHNHIFNADNGAGGINPEVERWSFSGIGDVQALARYNFFSDGMSNAGVRFGVKLPTGSINKANSEEKAERTLQPGSGSVDTLLGAYYNQHHGSLGWFVQAMWQQPVNDRDDFKPGTKLGMDAGLNYSVTPDLNLMLQTNVQYKGKDSGANAEPKDSGGYSLSISPGLSYKTTESSQVYGFVQKPIYQYVNGFQLTSDWSVAVGLTTHF